MNLRRSARTPLPLGALAAVALFAGNARADLTPEWITNTATGSALSSGFSDMVVTPAGVTYATGITGPSWNTDVLTVAIDAAGTFMWSHQFNGPGNWHDQSRGIALGLDGKVYVCGNTPGPGNYADVLVLEYDALTGALLDTIQFASAPFKSEHAADVIADAAGNVYVTGGTVGDSADVMTVKFDSTGAMEWVRTWDGPAFAPYSQDHGRQLLFDPAGDIVLRVHGVWFTNHPDYVAIKYSSDGTQQWVANWGVNGGDFASDMVIDASGDVYMTGIGIDFIDKISTIKLRGTDGSLLWQAYDAQGFDHSARALVLDGQGGVVITGASDPDGDNSNFNDDYFTIRRDAQTGAQLWTHAFGASCVGCFDVPTDVLVDPVGNVFVAGSSRTAPYSGDVLTFVLDLATGLERTRGVVSGTLASSGYLGFDAAYALYNASSTYDANTGATGISVFKYPSQVMNARNGRSASQPSGLKLLHY